MLNKTLINFRPFLFLAISVALGIGAGYLFYFDKILLGVIVTLIFLLFIAFVILFSGGEIKKKLFFGIAFVLIFAFGLGAFCIQVSEFDKANLDGHYYTVNGKVTSASVTDYGQKLTVKKASIQGNRTGKIRYGINVYVYGQTQFEVGDLVKFDSYLHDVSVIYEDRLLATNVERGIKYTATVEGDEITKTGENVTIFEAINLYIRNSITAGMGEKEGAVAIGMLLGSTDEMDEDLLSSYRSSGIAHIFAVSGLHIGFLATALNFLFDKFRVKRLIKAICITLVLFFYSGVCGFSASSLRASVMCAVLLFSSIQGNRYDGLTSVGIACALLLTCSPIHLFCVGFELSFTVVLGIILLSPPLTKLFSFLPKKLASSLGTVVSAQLAGIPISLYAFKEFSTIAILANLVFVPISGVVFIMLFLMAIIGGLGISEYTLFIPKYVLMGINYVITAIDYKVFIVGGITMGVFVIFYYLALVLPCGLINLKKMTKIITSITCALIFIAGTTVISIQENRTPKAFVIGDDKVCATVIKNNDENIMVISQAESYFSASKFRRLATNEKIEKIDYLIFSNCGAEMQQVVTRLNQVFTLEKVWYYGITDFSTEQVISNAFNLNVRAFNDGEDLMAKTTCAYTLNGKVVDFNINGKRLAVFSEFSGNNAGYVGLSGKYDYMVASDYAEFIYEEYSPSELVCYKDSTIYKSAINSGTVTIKIK